MNIGDRIKKLREQEHISQTDLAAFLRTTKQTIYKYENNIVTNIPSDRIEKMAKILHTTPTYLMGWDDPFSESSATLHARMANDTEFQRIYFYWEQLTDIGKNKLIEYTADLFKIYKK